MNCRAPLLFLLCGAVVFASSRGLAGPKRVTPFFEKYCFECHDGDSRKGGLDLSELRFDLTNSASYSSWVKVYDRVSKGEMPPKQKPRPTPKDLSAFSSSLGSDLMGADRQRIGREGRATQRRLNRYEYEETLRDLLLLPYLEVKAFLPEDRESHGFNKIGDALDVSHVQMGRYLTAAEFALREAVAPQVESPQCRTNRYYTWDEGEFFGRIKLEGPLNRRTFPLVGLALQSNLMAEANPRRPAHTGSDEKEQESMAVVVSTYEPTEIRFGNFHAPVSGRYRLKFRGYSIWMNADFTAVSRANRTEPVSVYAETPPRILRKLRSFDVGPDPTEYEMETWLLAGETIRPDAARLFRSRPPDHKNPLATKEGMPGVALGWMEVKGPIVGEWPPASHRVLFGDLPLRKRTDEARSRSLVDEMPQLRVEVVSQAPEQDARRLLEKFMEHAYREPVRAMDVERFLQVFRTALNTGHSFTESMIAGYTGVLCSPGFLYLREQPGRLSDLALAERLAYFLWNSCPDSQLQALAQNGKLHKPVVLREQTERLLKDARSRRFVDAFLNYWLDLRLISGTEPDGELYPDYQLDDLLVESMIEETQLFFSTLIRDNLSITNVVNSDFAMLNERLASQYGIAGVTGVQVKRVPLAAGSVRGGFLTQASILKVTANGTTTSPVKRGAWIMTRLMGKPPPPPPASVPAVDPDTRGATTIREQLAKHRTQPACAACHRNIDPAGFALESFDVMGAWRDRYRSTGEGERIKGFGHNGIKNNYCLGPAVDPSGEMPDGRTFRDVRELKQLLLMDKEQLARNLVEQLVTYATGCPPSFSDRPGIAKIVEQSRKTDYGIRTLIHGVVQSEMFLNK